MRLLLAAQRHFHARNRGKSLILHAGPSRHRRSPGDERQRSDLNEPCRFRRQTPTDGKCFSLREGRTAIHDRSLASQHSNAPSKPGKRPANPEAPFRSRDAWPADRRISSFYRETERALTPHLADMPDLAFSSRFHARQIAARAELRRRGTLSADPVFPAIGTVAEALGAFYVIEGSSLGGKTILKALRSQGAPTDELDFLDPYGSESGARWRSFLNVLERETGHGQSTTDACVSGAIKGFAFAAMCLRAERTN
jgi:heme oxygenase